MINPDQLLKLNTTRTDCINKRKSLIWDLLVSCLIIALLISPKAQADAVIMTRAMKASTIVELFVEEGQLRMELEIGANDLKKFHHLLPDEMLHKLSIKAPDFEERLPQFFSHGLTIQANSGETLKGKVTSMKWQQRTQRDPITGEPVLPTKPEGVLAVKLLYTLSGEPDTLTITPPLNNSGKAVANIGLILYHQGIPVNDFRHLSSAQVIDIDWEDAWYSKFRHKNYNRFLNESMNVFLYVEPYEVRVEVISRPKDLLQWIDLGLNDADTIPVEIQSTLKEKAASLLAQHINLQVDGVSVTPDLERIHFLRRNLRASTVINPAEELNLGGAILGAVYVYRTEGLPHEASISWGLFPSKEPRVRSAATDETGPLPSILTPEDNILVWENFLLKPTIPKLIAIDLPLKPLQWSFSVVSVFCLVGLAVVLVITIKRRHPSKLLIVAAILLAGFIAARPYTRTSIAVPYAKAAPLPDDEANFVISTLLKNVYVAFDFREEDKIYDTLARSADGDLLTKIYLETKKSLELQNQGGARVKVKNVELIESTREKELEEGGFITRCKWNVRGSVGHWGHIHQRTNQYEAKIHVKIVDGEWKITDLELLQEERVL